MKRIFKPKRRDAYDDVFDMLHMTKIDREIISRAFQKEVRNAKYRYYFTTTLYTFLNNIITIGSVLVVSFISLEKISLISSQVAEVFFWAGWIISIVVVVASKLMGSFGLQRKFVTDKMVLEKYRNEGWKFASRIGHYRDKPIGESFKMFMHKIQKIKMNLAESSSQSGESRGMFNSEFNMRNYQGGIPSIPSIHSEHSVPSMHSIPSDKMYMQSADISPDIFNKFEYGDIQLEEFPMRHDNINVGMGLNVCDNDHDNAHDNVVALEGASKLVTEVKSVIENEIDSFNIV
jgi:hypothetical protein